MTEPTKPRGPWTPVENNALWALYFAMLDKAVTGRPYNKAAMIREATLPTTQPAGRKATPYSSELRNRSKQSVEFKLMNATAAHQDIRLESTSADGRLFSETMHGHGYRAMPNYQGALKDAGRIHLESRGLAASGLFEELA